MPEQLDIPEFLDRKIQERYPDAADEIHSGYRATCERPVTLRANALRSDAAEVTSALNAAGVAHEGVAWYEDAFIVEGVRERAIWEMDIYREGKVYLQSLSSMLPPLALEPRVGADILDMCAAPGGKTSQIAALTGGAAHITACEMNGPRAEKLSYNLEKLGAKNIQVMRTDARKLDEFFSFDQILLDAPCTGSGTICANDERAARRLTPKLLDKVMRSQRALLDRALTVLKPGGTLIYSTCSILKEENEEQIRAVLSAKRHRDCELKPVAIEGLLEGERAPRILPTDLEGSLTVCPDRLYEGFFIAQIQKNR